MYEIKENSNILNVHTGYILHGVNCKGVMGSGVAKQLVGKYPQIFKQYKVLCDRAPTPEYLLGVVDTVIIDPQLSISNCFTQAYYGKDGKKYASYDALDSCLEIIAHYAPDDEMHIPYLMCAGLGGLEEGVVLEIIKHRLAKHETYLHKFKPL